MREPKILNTVIFDHSRDILLRSVKLDRPDELLYSYNAYCKALNKWYQENINRPLDLEILSHLRRTSKELSLKSSKSDIDHYLNEIRGLVYIIMKQNHILYIGSTSTSFNDRYRIYNRTKLFNTFIKNYGIYDSVFIYPTSNYRNIESTLINTASALELPLCNVRCEDKVQLLKFISFFNENPKATYQDFLGFRTNKQSKKGLKKVSSANDGCYSLFD